MGRGKKDKKPPKEELPPIGGLTIDDAPSTSGAPAPAQTPAQVPPSEPAPKQETKEEAAEEESFEGLTGAGKKKRPRKKKTAAETDEPKPPPQQKQPAPKVSAPQQQSQPQASGPSTFAPPSQQAQVLQSQPPPGLQPGFRGPSPQIQQGQSGPPQGPNLQPRGVQPFYKGPFPQSQQGQPGPPQGAPGLQPHPASLRGPSPQQFQQGQPGPPQGAPGLQPHPASVRGPSPQSQQGRTPPTQTIAQSGQPRQTPHQQQQKPIASGDQTASASSASLPETKFTNIYDERRAREREATQKCRFRIPEKIIGRSVRSRPIDVLCNYLPMDITPIIVYRYDVGVKPDRPKKMVPVAFNSFFQSKFPRVLVAYDQNKNFYSPKKLPGVNDKDRLGANVTVKDPNGRDMTFEVSIKATGEINLNILLEYMKKGSSLNPPTEAIQCVDVILRQGSLGGYVKAGRTYFRRPTNPLRLGDGLEMWTGLFQSAIFTSRPWINIDVAHKGFPIHQPVEKLLEEFRLDSRQALDRQRGVEHLTNMLKGLKISAFLGGDKNVRRELICNGLGQPADKQMFVIDDPSGRQMKISVADYFLQVKKIRLRMPYMNTLWLGPRDKHIYYPLEFCDVAPNQVLNKQLNDRQLATIVKEAATPPDIRKRKIEDVVQAMDYTRNVYFKEFGLKVSESFAQVKAKLLNAPVIKYQDKTVIPKFGVWWSSCMLSGAQIKSWALLALERDVRAVNGENLLRFLKDQSRQMGINMADPVATLYNVPVAQLETNLSRAKKEGCQFVLVVVPTERGPRNVYSEIKKIAERTVGMLTQCVREQTLQRINAQTAKNILLKINAKMTGINHAIDTASLPTCLARGGVMVVGADVTHPSPDQQNIPSIAAVTASMDNACTIYSLGMSIQTPKMEIIVELEDMMVEHLQTYRKRLGTLPSKIYMFRDGVSEGQFALVLNSELVAIYNAFRRLSGSEKKPEVLFLLVQKRHHTRLFVPNSRDNVSAGTVVDTDIVHPRELDFYLVSHAAIKGTARPTRYYCIRNDGSLPHDEVEQLAYYLCHLYSRCSRAVSYPTPTYYAHLACLRARVLTLGEKFDNSVLEKKPRRLRILDNMQQNNPMFFV